MQVGGKKWGVRGKNSKTKTHYLQAFQRVFASFASFARGYI